MEMKKFNHGAAVIDKALKILQGCAVAAVIVSLIFIPLTLIFGEKVIADASTIEVGNMALHLAGNAGDYLNISNVKASISVLLSVAALISAAVWYCLRVLREILAPMKEGSPFTAGTSGKIRKLAWTVLAAGAVIEAGSVLSSMFELQAYHIDQLFNRAAVSSITYNLKTGFWFVVPALFLFFLSYVFRYGEELQRESDETL